MWRRSPLPPVKSSPAAVMTSLTMATPAPTAAVLFAQRALVLYCVMEIPQVPQPPPPRPLCPGSTADAPMTLQDFSSSTRRCTALTAPSSSPLKSSARCGHASWSWSASLTCIAIPSLRGDPRWAQWCHVTRCQIVFLNMSALFKSPNLCLTWVMARAHQALSLLAAPHREPAVGQELPVCQNGAFL